MNLIYDMSRNVKDILVIFLVSIVLGVSRSIIIGDISVIKYPIEEISEEQLVDANLDGPKIIKIDQSKKMYDSKTAFFIDARDSLLFKEGHISGAINIHFESHDDDAIIEKLDGIASDDFLIIYCSGGDCDLSEELGNHLFEYLFYENILLYEGGFPEWEDSKYPITYGQ